MEKVLRALAFLYGVCLAIGEAVINWGHWQYAPLWIVDYIVVFWLIYGALIKDGLKSAKILLGGWSFSLGVMYMALAVSTAPEFIEQESRSVTLYFLNMLLILMSLVGLVLSYITLKNHEGRVNHGINVSP